MKTKYKVGQLVDVTDNGNYGNYANISDTGRVVAIIPNLIEVEIQFKDDEGQYETEALSFYAHELKEVEEK